MTITTIRDLPQEIILHVMSFSNVLDLASLQRACRSINTIVQEWKKTAEFQVQVQVQVRVQIVHELKVANFAVLTHERQAWILEDKIDAARSAMLMALPSVTPPLGGDDENPALELSGGGVNSDAMFWALHADLHREIAARDKANESAESARGRVAQLKIMLQSC